MLPGFLFWVALIYAATGTLLTHLLGRPLIGLFFQRQHMEADFRFSLARLREYTEQVALLNGESAEQEMVGGRFRALVANYIDLVHRRVKVYGFTQTFGQISPIIPYIFTAPFYFAGKIELGIMTQTASAFARVADAMTFFVNYYTYLAGFKSVVDRLNSFDAAIDQAQALSGAGPAHVAAAAGVAAIDLDDIDLAALPDAPGMCWRTSHWNSRRTKARCCRVRPAPASRRCFAPSAKLAVRFRPHHRPRRRPHHGGPDQALHPDQHAALRRHLSGGGRDLFGILKHYDGVLSGDAWHGDPVWKVLEDIPAATAAARPLTHGSLDLGDCGSHDLLGRRWSFSDSTASGPDW